MAAGKNQQGLRGLLGPSGRAQQSFLYWPGQAERCSLPPVTAISLPPGKTTPTIGQEAEARRAQSPWEGSYEQELSSAHPSIHANRTPGWQGPELFQSPESITDLGLCKAVNRQEKVSTFTIRETGISKQRWWCMPIALALGSQGYEGAGVLGKPELS